MAISRICSIEGCSKPDMRRGWCQAHYARWLRHGDPIGGRKAKTPEGEPLQYFRDVVLNYEGDECLIWPYGRDRKGYGRLKNPETKTQIVSRMICQHVNGPPPTPKHLAAHSCANGAGGCCAKRPMEWKTNAENMADMVRQGGSCRGSRHGQAILKEADIPKIKALIGIMTHKEIGEIYGTSPNTISEIVNGRTWTWLGDSGK